MGYASRMNPDGSARDPLAYDSFVLSCPCGNKDVYGVQVIEVSNYTQPLSDADLLQQAARFSEFV
jgi:hypothetical protein